jgi:transposase
VVPAAQVAKLARRAAIPALADAGVARTCIANVLGCALSTVHRWIRRAEDGQSLHDRARSGRPCLYPQEVQLRITAFYCQTQPLPGCGRWTLRWAERRLRADAGEVGAAPAKSTLHRMLQRNRLKPHQSRYFLQITDPDFFPKMERLLALYRRPPANLFFFDECPGIQILKRLTPDLQTDAMRKRLEEFEYVRHGTLDVLAFLHHASGEVFMQCRADHKTETFLAVFRHHVEQCPHNEPLHYVMDNPSSHRGYPFCQLVAELSAVACPSKQQLHSVEKRVDWLAREDKRIVVHFTPYHGSWLNWIEFWFGILGRKVLGESFGSPDAFKAALEAFVMDWNTLLAHPFRWTYDGEGLHQKAVQRFTQMLRGLVTDMDLRILTKLLRLATNLLRDYFPQVSQETWAELDIVLTSQHAALDEYIQREPGPKRKLNAQNAMAGLQKALNDLFPAGRSATT